MSFSFQFIPVSLVSFFSSYLYPGRCQLTLSVVVLLSLPDRFLRLCFVPRLCRGNCFIKYFTLVVKILFFLLFLSALWPHYICCLFFLIFLGLYLWNNLGLFFLMPHLWGRWVFLGPDTCRATSQPSRNLHYEPGSCAGYRYIPPSQ